MGGNGSRRRTYGRDCCSQCGAGALEVSAPVGELGVVCYVDPGMVVRDELKSMFSFHARRISLRIVHDVAATCLARCAAVRFIHASDETRAGEFIEKRIRHAATCNRS